MNQEKNMSIIGHLEDLRRVIIICLISIVVATLVIYFAFKDDLMFFFTLPMKRMNVDLVYITITEGFLTQIKMSFFIGLLVSLPIILWQIWNFILPALHVHERKTIIGIVPASFILFLAGISFAYLMVFPMAAAFLIGISGESLSPMISISKYISFLISFTLPFGIVFQLPLVVLLLTKLGIVSPQLMVVYRKYAILAIVVLSALLTPPDVISLTLMAIPMLILYEISIILAKIFTPKKPKAESEDSLDEKSEN